MTEQMLSASAGALLSLLFSYVPGLSDWYGGLAGSHKRLVMLAALAVTAAGALALACLEQPRFSFPGLPACSQGGLQGMLESFLAALVTNQATYLITTRSQASAPAGRDESR